MGRKIIAVDFDGTLICGNSLHEYIWAGMADAAARLSVGRLFRLLALVACRAVKVMPHETFKRRCAVVVGFPPSVKRRFDKRVASKLRLGLLSALRACVARGYEVIVASAAFQFYLDKFEPIEGFTLIASPVDGPDCRGKRKEMAVEAYASERDAVIEAVVTDHHDDIPLLLSAPRHILVAPSRETVARVGAAMPYVLYEDGCDFLK